MEQSVLAKRNPADTNGLPTSNSWACFATASAFMAMAAAICSKSSCVYVAIRVRGRGVRFELPSGGSELWFSVSTFAANYGRDGEYVQAMDEWDEMVIRVGVAARSSLLTASAAAA